MKELSVKEKAKRYDVAVKKAKSKITGDKDHILYEDDVIEMFPELNESEDERIKNEIISAIEEDWPGHTDWIVWLEMRGKTFTKKDVDDAYLKGICDAKHELEKQGEQKPAEWSIKDAKAGDVLNSIRVQATIIFKGFADDGKHILAYCALQKGIFIKREMLWDRDFEPASEYWKNALYDAMVKEGYDWDADELKLTKGEQKPAWSEEDERIRQDIENLIHFALRDGSAVSPAAYTTKEDAISWIQSIKERIKG